MSVEGLNSQPLIKKKKKTSLELSKLNKLIIMSLGLTTYLEDAQKRKEQEQADYVQKIVR